MSDLQVIATLEKNRRERLRIALDVWQGHELLDIRVVTELTESSGTWVPGKKGVSLQRSMLPSLIDALLQAHQKHFGKPYEVPA